MEKRKTYTLFRWTANFPHVRRSLFLLQWLSVGECKRVSFKSEGRWHKTTRRETSMINIADVKDKLDGKVLQQNIDYVLEA